MALSKAPFKQLNPLGGTSQDKLQERLRGQDSYINRLNNEADGLKIQLHKVEESKQSLNNNRQFRESQEKYETQIQSLEGDKVNLMKRLNMVLSELEKATHEKSEVHAKLLEQERMADDLKRKLEEVSSLKNVVNRNLQEDLRYERDLNEKLKQELGKFDREKDLLLSKLQEQEEVSRDISRETNAMNSNLQKKNDDLRRLERDHQHNLERLRDLNNQLDGLKSQDMHSKTEKRRMEEELEDLTRERNELIRRMNELSDKYEDYVSTMNRERIEIMKANKNHVKLLTAKLFFQILSESVHWKRKDAFQEMKGCATQIQSMESKLYTFTRVVSNQVADAKRHYLRLWFRHAMNFTHENYKKLNLVEYNVDKKRKIKFYFKWRQAFLNLKKSYECKTDSIKMLRCLVSNKQDQKARKSLCKWKDFVELRQYQQDFTCSIMTRKKLRDQRTGFVTWLAVTKKAGLEERHDKMSELVTNLWFKQRVFLGLRQAALESKTETSTLKFKAWKNWCETSRKNKYFSKKKLLVERIEGTRSERLVKQVFDAIRFHNVQRQYEETKEKLDLEIPVRQELERKRDNIVKINKTKDKYNLFRQCCIRYADVKYRALMIWKENLQYYKHIMSRVKLRLIETHKRGVSRAFFRWKESIDKKHMIEMVSFTDELMNENQELKNTLSQSYQEREKLSDCSLKQQSTKLQRVRNLLNRNLLRKRFYRWVYNAERIVNLEDALFKTSKTINRRKLKNGFSKYKKKVQEVKRLEYVRGKVDWFGDVRDKKTLSNSFQSWRDNIRRFKSARTFLCRSIKGVDKLMTNEAFTVWKSLVYQARKQVYISNIEELGKRQVEHDAQIKDLNKQIQISDSSQKHLISKMQSQSHKIMANFIARSIHVQMAKGFFTWVETLREQNNKKRFLRNTLNYWIKNSQGKAFRKWSDFSLRAKENELSKKLQMKEVQRKTLQKQKEEEEKHQSSDVEVLQQQLQDASQLKEQLQANFEKAFETHVSRMRNNTYVEKRRNIFCVWADYIKKEKNAINTIGALARKSMRMEVFTRVRLVARENYLDAKADKIMNNFARMFKANIVNHAFSRWRTNSYTHLVTKMCTKQEELEYTRQHQTVDSSNMQVQKHRKAERILKQRRQLEVSSAWITMTKVLKALRVKQEILKQNVVYMQQRDAIKKWQKRTKVTLLLRRKDKKVVARYQTKTLKACFQGWTNRVKIAKLLCQRTIKFYKRLSFLEIAQGFQQIVHYKKSFDERVRESKEHGNLTIYKTLNRLLKHKKADALLNLKNRAFKRDFKEKFLHRVFKHSLLYRTRHYFGKWKHTKERMELAEKINLLQSEGDVVLERNEMKRNVKALRDFLQKQGYSEEEVGTYLQNKSEQQKANMQKAIVGLFFKNSEFSIMPKAMNQWKRWIQMRKLCKRQAEFVVNGLRHPLFWAFRQWKYQEDNARQKLKDVTKQDLVDKIITDEMAIGSGQSRLTRMNDAIEHLNIQRDSLLQHFVSGQKLALALGKNNYQKTMFRAFLSWKRHTKTYEQDRLAEQIGRTNQMINDLEAHVGKLGNINNNLVEENEELRQAALDGIEIAKAVQELTREREQLSEDLQDRGHTIKKLIDDNNSLSLRLSIAQKEAEQLENLNQQSYYAPAEREKYY